MKKETIRKFERNPLIAILGFCIGSYHFFKERNKLRKSLNN